MEERKIDRRVLRTRRCIRQAFIELVMEKEYTNITVSDIAQRAGINRRTFYLHYASVDEVMAELEQEIVDRVRTFQDYVNLLDPESDSKPMFHRLTELLSEYAPLLERMVQIESYHFFFERLKRTWQEALLERYSSDLLMSREEFMLQIEFFTAGIISLYARWMSDRTCYSIDEVNRVAVSCTTAWRETVLKNKKNELYRHSFRLSDL